MNKKQIIDKIIDDLPTYDVRGEMSHDEWYGWFEEAFDKGYAEALRIPDVVGQSKQLKPLPPNECVICGTLIDSRLTTCGGCGF